MDISSKMLVISRNFVCSLIRIRKYPTQIWQHFCSDGGKNLTLKHQTLPNQECLPNVNDRYVGHWLSNHVKEMIRKQ